MLYTLLYKTVLLYAAYAEVRLYPLTPLFSLVGLRFISDK